MYNGSWIRIEDSSRFLSQFEPQLIHPDDPRWISFWREMKRRCIEGVWFEDFGKWRYGRGNLGFYHHYCRIPDLNIEHKIHGEMIRPLIRDLEWHRSYYLAEAMGFSGFSDDDKYTSEKAIFNIDRNKISISDPKHLRLFQSNGKFKEYIEPRDNLFRLHDKPVGRPTYNNPAKNYLELGARGGGKSMYSILGEVKYAVCFNGLKYYDDKVRLNPPSIKINVGSGIKSKSSDTLHHMQISMDNLALDPGVGTWGEPEDIKRGGIYEPCPFWKNMAGDFNTDAKNGWHELIERKEGNSWIKQIGPAVYHKSYSSNKKTGAEAGAGGRRTLILYEEIGLFEDLLAAWASDEAVVSIDGYQFAPRIGIGTSGNLDTIAAARKIMTHPEEYNCLVFPGEQEDEKQCMFLSAIIVDKNFKDKNGNTDIAAATKFYEDKLEEKLKTNDATIINGYKMNHPTKVEHMWVSKTGDLLPVKEAELRERQLLRNNLFESIGTPIELFWSNEKPEGVDYRVNPALEPFYDTNYDDRKSLDGAVVLYEQPFRINGMIPLDAHIFTHDPYVSDAWDEGGSLGVTHVWINPKYIPYGAKGNCLAATYIGKHIKGVDGYNEVLEKLCAFYGNPFRSLWYESNRGDRLRSYFLKKNKANLLCLQPQFEQGQHIYLRNTNKTGFVVGSEVSKISLIDRLNEWLLEETQLAGEEEPIQNIFRIPCIFTIRQIKAYSLKGNFDAVSSMLGWPLALGEIQHNIMENMNPQRNPLGIMTKYLKQRLGA